ncbi:hypothetical protein LCGC14_2856220, partial [marine sediment metagenome]
MMAQTWHNQIGGFLSGRWVAGPIFGKELRTSSRRRRTYVLRSVYLILLTAFVVLVWLAEVQRGLHRGSLASRVAYMPEAGKIIIMCIVWFQFCAMQLVAVVMLSTAISDEIHGRTLGVLMTTPINSFQVVMGKLLSKLWQLIILVGISLPLLAVVRVFGGVPWEFLVAGVCTTLTAMLFAAAVAMFFSVYCRRAYVAILLTLVVGGGLYLLVPFVVIMALKGSYSERQVLPPLCTVNPFGALILMTDQTIRPWRAGRWAFSWEAHCLAMLVAAAAVLAVCVRVVRKATLRQIAGGTGAGASIAPPSA